MATSEEYAAWIVKNADKRGTPAFDTVAAAYKDARSKETAVEPGQIPVDPSKEFPAPAPTAREQQPSGGLIDKVKGIGEAAIATATAIPASIYGTAVGLSNALRSGQFGTPEGANLAEKTATQSMQANTYAPRTEAGKNYLENVGTVAQNLAPIAGLPNELSAISAGSKPALQAAGDFANSTKSKVAAAMIPTIDPEVARLARVAEKYDIPIAPHMLGDNRIGKMIGNAAEQDIPLSFSKTKAREASFVNAVLKQFDPEATATKITPDVYAEAMKKSGGKISDIAAKTTLPSSDELRNSLASISKSAKDYGADVYRLVKARENDLTNLITDGKIDGSAFKKWNTNVLEDMRSGSDVTKSALGKLQETAMDAFESSISKEDLPAWKQARQNYAIGKQLQTIVAKSPTGDIRPSDLMQAVTRGKEAQSRMAYGRGGDLGDLARIGQQFLKEPSGYTIPERNLGYLAMGAGMYTNPLIAAPVWTGASAYNSLGPKISRALTKIRPNPLSETP
jgi:hypothetical protein